MLGDNNYNMLGGLFNENWDSEYEIIESDAGQKYIDQRESDEAEIKRQERELQKEIDFEELSKYINLQRNNLCSCGSHKKYKKCCLPRITILRNKYRI